MSNEQAKPEVSGRTPEVSRRKFLASSTALATAVGALSGVGTFHIGRTAPRCE